MSISFTRYSSSVNVKRIVSGPFVGNIVAFDDEMISTRCSVLFLPAGYLASIGLGNITVSTTNQLLIFVEPKPSLQPPPDMD